MSDIIITLLPEIRSLIGARVAAMEIPKLNKSAFHFSLHCWINVGECTSVPARSCCYPPSLSFYGAVLIISSRERGV